VPVGGKALGVVVCSCLSDNSSVSANAFAALLPHRAINLLAVMACWPDFFPGLPLRLGVAVFLVARLPVGVRHAVDASPACLIDSSDNPCRLPAPLYHWPGSCGKSPPGSSDRYSARPCGLLRWRAACERPLPPVQCALVLVIS